MRLIGHAGLALGRAPSPPGTEARVRIPQLALLPHVMLVSKKRLWRLRRNNAKFKNVVVAFGQNLVDDFEAHVERQQAMPSYFLYLQFFVSFGALPVRPCLTIE